MIYKKINLPEGTYYIVKCKLCGEEKQTRHKNQLFCSKKCSGYSNIKKRIYRKKDVKDKSWVNSQNTHKSRAVLCGATDKGIGKLRRQVYFPKTEHELYKLIKNGNIISRPCIIEIIKSMKSYQDYIGTL